MTETELRERVDALVHDLRATEDEHASYCELFEAAPDACFVTDALGVIRDANGRACDLFGLDRSFIEGKPLAVYVAPSSRPQLRDALATRESFELRLDLEGRRSRTAVHLRAVHLDANGEGREGRDARMLWFAREETGRAAPHDSSELARALLAAEELVVAERHRRESLEREARAKDQAIADLSRAVCAQLEAVVRSTEVFRREVLARTDEARALAAIDEETRRLLCILEARL